MYIQDIEKAFAAMITQRNIHVKLGESSDIVRRLRYNLKNGINISLDRKIELLKKSGWREDAAKYTSADLVALINFYTRTSQSARDKGPEYVVEKWEAVRKNK